VVAAPTTIEVTQESPMMVPARLGSEFLCSATYLLAVMPSPPANKVVSRLVVASMIASSPKSAAPRNLAQAILLTIVSALASPAPKIDHVAPVAILL